MSATTHELEEQIRLGTPWIKLPTSLKEWLNNSQASYERAILDYSIANQLPWRGNLVRHVLKNERKYYEDTLQYCRNHLMLYPYHIQDQLVQGLKVTPFQYYHTMVEMILVEQKSYDSLPNFTARDCMRLLGIARNEYIDIMNKYRSKRFWRRKSPAEFLTSRPVDNLAIEPWWLVNVGYVTEEEIERCTKEEHKLIDHIINAGPQLAGTIDRTVITSLYNRQLIYLVISIEDSDYIVVPPLQGFVMNRVQGDRFENLLYKVFVSINEHTNIAELASVLQTNLQEVKNAVSVFIRLGFAHKKISLDSSSWHNSWRQDTSFTDQTSRVTVTSVKEGMELVMEDFTHISPSTSSPTVKYKDEVTLSTVAAGTDVITGSGSFKPRIGFLFDSTLTAFLMMGNLSPGLKNHAVTMFEVGKLTDEVLDSFLEELDKVDDQPEGEGEAQRYFQHALTLRDTVQFLRRNGSLSLSGGDLPGLDLLRCESMNSLDQGTLCRLLRKNYCVLVSMAPLSQEVQSISSCDPPHIGPAIPEMNSIWFRLWLYHKLKCGPPSLLLTRGTRLTILPRIFWGYSKILLTSWGHDTAVVSTSNLLITVNEALTHSAVLVQGYGWKGEGLVKHIAFPFDRKGLPEDDLLFHPVLKQLETITDLSHTCGYVAMLNTGAPPTITTPKPQQSKQSPDRKNEEISEFLDDLRELGIGGDQTQPPPNQSSLPSTQCNDESPVVPESVRKLTSEWVPLELCYGVPLFSDETNKSVCQKIVGYGLFREESLRLMTAGSRLLVLDLLEFITQHQDVNFYSHSASVDTNSKLIGRGIPLPTRCLIFNEGILETFRR